MTETVYETVTIAPTPYPKKGWMWWFRTGDTYTAPLTNNNEPYLPTVTNQFLRDFLWFWRNPAGNLVGFVIGFEGSGFTVSGPAPVLLTTLRDAVPEEFGWKYSFINGWAPFISYNGAIEFYLGWRPSSGGLGAKLNWKTFWSDFF